MGLLTAISVGLMVGGTIWNAVGQIKSGNAAKKIGDFNAAADEAQAVDALLRGKEDEGRFRTEVRGMIGSQRAGLATNNVDVGFGSAVDVQADAAFLGELDALTLRNNAAREAWGFRIDAENARLGGQQRQRESRYAAAGTILGAGGSLLAARYGYRDKK
jgi:hypothetical protein